MYKQEGNWMIRTNDRGIPELAISEMYKDLSEDNLLKGKDKKFLNERIDKANMLIQAVDQRRHTLISVMECIIEKQPAFFEGEIDVLEPMKFLIQF